LRGTHLAVDADDVPALVKLNTEGRVEPMNGGAREILPGISCYIGGKQTYASQFMTVRLC
jgi:hypothetical protein